mgnify:FL=1
MEYFELPQLEVDSEANINAINQLQEYFQPVSLESDGHQVVYEGVDEDANPDNWLYYQDRDHGADFDSHPLIEDIVDKVCTILNLPKDKIVRRQYTQMKPGWSLNIHRDVARQVALLVEFIDAKCSITWYDNNKKPTKTLIYGKPVVVNTKQLHSAKADKVKRYGFQIDFDYNMSIDDVYNSYKTSPMFLNQEE